MFLLGFINYIKIKYNIVFDFAINKFTLILFNIIIKDIYYLFYDVVLFKINYINKIV